MVQLSPGGTSFIPILDGNLKSDLQNAVIAQQQSQYIILPSTSSTQKQGLFSSEDAIQVKKLTFKKIKNLWGKLTLQIRFFFVIFKSFLAF